MPEKKENVSTVKFLSVFGPKVLCAEEFDPADDQCDQRAPVNNPEELYNMFIVPEEVMSELENESIEDFEGDVYDYEDRTDLGVDIALASEISLKKSKKNINKQSKQAGAEEEVEVNENEQSAAE